MLGLTIFYIVSSLLCYMIMKNECRTTFNILKKDGYTLKNKVDMKELKTANIIFAFLPGFNLITIAIIATSTKKQRQEEIDHFETIGEKRGLKIEKSKDSTNIDEFIKDLDENQFKLAIKKIVKSRDVKDKHLIRRIFAKNIINTVLNGNDVSSSLDNIRKELNNHKKGLKGSIPTIEVGEKKEKEYTSTPTLNVEEYPQIQYMKK